MNITVICTGKLKNSRYAAAVAEYTRRLPPGVRLKWVEVKGEKLGKISEAEAKRNEGKRILAALPAGAEVIALDETGEMLDSKGFARRLGDLRNRGRDLAFIIGGPLGLSPEVKTHAHRLLAFSRLTFQHDLVRVLLAEQIYRAFSILFGQPYHK
jgi:23S rRNA (pseudouridine1915-N3)-methyltransferase